jgi:signal transduction histidine kinase
VEEALVGFRKLLRDRGIEVKVSVRAPLPAIRGDRTSIVFALDNLIDNAMRHAGATHIELEARLNDNAVEFVVSDHGRGIPQDDLKRVQQPFVRGGTTGRGSGLGLAIVRRIVAEHGGSIDVTDNVPTGTRFIIELPT